MLVSLSVQNYALIKKLQVDFTVGYSVITGETGAGKSILLGALGLVLGNRADLSCLKDKDKKCVIEAEFEIETYQLQSVFEDLALDYEPLTIVRRELLPNGKTRAFVNDTPVNLKSLQALKNHLLDIHSQHNTLALSDKSYQYHVIDALADNTSLLILYRTALKAYKKAVKELSSLKASQQEAQQQYEYNLHLYQELQDANLKELNEVEVLEADIEKLSHTEDIITCLQESLQITTEEQIGLQTLFNQLQNTLSKIAPFEEAYNQLHQRIKSLKIELDDLVFELEKHTENIEVNPKKLEVLNDRLTLLMDLQKKHFVTNLEGLITVKESLSKKVAQVEDAEALLLQSATNLKNREQEVLKIAQQISKNRNNILTDFKTKLEVILSKLGMENAQFKVGIKPMQDFTEYGTDDVDFLLASNKGTDFGLLKKVASGGELSRIMLGIKIILSKVIKLPTILFDEIDTGVSGEIATKIAGLMLSMGKNMQVITISHLPQVAAKGQTHYKVYKQIESQETVTYLKKLNTEQRILEIAEMLSGKDKSQSALEHATQLLSI